MNAAPTLFFLLIFSLQVIECSTKLTVSGGTMMWKFRRCMFLGSRNTGANTPTRSYRNRHSTILKVWCLTTLSTATIVQHRWWENEYGALVEWYWQGRVWSIGGMILTGEISCSSASLCQNLAQVACCVLVLRPAATSWTQCTVYGLDCWHNAKSAAAPFLRSRVQVLLRAWLFVSCICCVLCK